MTPTPPCVCGHLATLHMPHGGGGRCTGAGCDCRAYVRRTTRPDEHLRWDGPADVAELADLQRRLKAGIGVPVDEAALALPAALDALEQAEAALARARTTITEQRETHAGVEAELGNQVNTLSRWKAEATVVLNGWDDVWRELGKPGPLGASKWQAARARVEELCAAIAARDEREVDLVLRAEQAEAALALPSDTPFGAPDAWRCLRPDHDHNLAHSLECRQCPDKRREATS